MPDSPSSQAEYNLQRIRAETFVAHVRYYDALPSTNDLGLNLSRDQLPQLPLLLLAGRQTAGRGRGTNCWWSSPGALTFSLLLDLADLQVAASQRPRISLATGLAVCDGVEQIVGRGKLDLKWPNDVFAGGRKLCGILAEVSPHQKDVLILGIGVNVNNVSVDAPAVLRRSVVSMRELVHAPVSLADTLIAILNHLELRFRWLRERPDELQPHWQGRCLLTGRKVRLELPTYCTWGVCLGVNDYGALVLATPEGTKSFLSGVIKQFA